MYFLSFHDKLQLNKLICCQKQFIYTLLIKENMKVIEKKLSCLSIQSKESKQQQQLQNKQENTPLTQQKKVSKKKLHGNLSLVANTSDTKYTVVKNVLKKTFNMKISKDPISTDWDIFWTDNVVTPEQLAKMKPHQKINHFPGMFTLSRKNYLARNLGKMQKLFPQEYSFYPKTWILPSQYADLKNYLQNQGNQHVVIAKPEASSQGKGIFLSKTIQDFQYGEHYVVQKYLKKPLIIDGLKFDLRIYVLVVGCDPLRLYIYKQGLARFATQLYLPPKKDNLSNLFMHLTNYSINKNSSKFQFNQSHNEMNKGHKRSLTSIATSLGNKWIAIWQQTKRIIAKTLISTQPILSHHYRSCQPENYANNMCFEILGFDIIIDSNYKPYLLEVNYTPSFSIDTPLDKHIKQNLIKDSLILMNITNKAKNDILNLKKKQLVERTLTGKKVWYTKQQREKIIKKYQKKRDIWQNSHLGNFQKILPINPLIEHDQYALYQKFLQYSQNCYENITGANIRRNNKVTSVPNTQQQFTFQGQPIRQGLKLTNNEQLQKIYKSNIKPMYFKKKKQGVNKTQSGQIPSMKAIVKQPISTQNANRTYVSKNRPNSAQKKQAATNLYNIKFKEYK